MNKFLLLWQWYSSYYSFTIEFFIWFISLFGHNSFILELSWFEIRQICLLSVQSGTPLYYLSQVSVTCKEWFLNVSVHLNYYEWKTVLWVILITVAMIGRTEVHMQVLLLTADVTMECWFWEVFSEIIWEWGPLLSSFPTIVGLADSFTYLIHISLIAAFTLQRQRWLVLTAN